MILNKAQAEAVYSAMVALNNVGATAKEIHGDGFYVRVGLASGTVNICLDSSDFSIPVLRERYEDQNAFATAYGLN